MKESGTIAKRMPYVRGFPVWLSRYVIFEEEPRRVAMRFYNGSDAAVTGLRFVLTELDADGNTIAENTLFRNGFLGETETEFAVADAAVTTNCAQVEVRVEVVVSDGYEYLIDGNSARLRYGVSKREKECRFSRAPSVRVRKRRKLLSVFGFAVVFGLAIAAGLFAWRFGLFEGIVPSIRGGAHAVSSCAEIVCHTLGIR